MKHTQNYPIQTSVICIAILLAISPIMGQTSGYWRIFFKDKGNEVIAPGSNLWYKTLEIHSQRSLDRRKQNNPKAPLITQADAPVNPGYISEVSKYVDTVILQLRWNNYIVVKTDSTRLKAIKELPFVKALQRTGVKLFPVSTNIVSSSAFVMKRDDDFKILSPVDNCGVFRYGPSLNQAAMLQIPQIHQMGIVGQGALLSFLDSGFQWKKHKATMNADVIGEKDFIQRDSVTANQQGDVANQDYHGSICYSTVSGFQQDSLIGIAPFSSFLLAKTEDIPTEQHLEEDNYAAAVEWSEAFGADVISSSLGYSSFDQPFEENYDFSDFNGKTTITARIVNEAVKRGVICVTAAGNSGPKDSTIITPSDADSVIAVAALSPDGITPANFTSRGPRSDGKIKPDIAAQGVSVICINPGDTSAITNANGTSLATPLIAGAMGLFVSAFPEKTAHEIREIVYRTANNAQSKNDTLGYGLANIHNAMLESGIVISPMITYPVEQYQRVVFLAQSAFPIMNMEMHIRKKGDLSFQSIKAYKYDTLHAWAIDMLKDTMSRGEYECFVIASDTKRERTYPPRLPNRDSVFKYSKNVSVIPCGIPEEILPKHSYPMSIAKESKQEGLAIVKSGEYHYQLYSLNGTLLKSGSIDLINGIYSQSMLQDIFGNTSIAALVIYDQQKLIYKTVLSPFLY
ncbi:MAG: S8 family serine peptidase [Candidatus Kapaibacteriota bacterium]